MLEEWVAAAADLVLGATCPGCARAWCGACPECRRALSRHPYRLVRPDPCPDGFPATATSAPYDEVLRGLISAHKEQPALVLTPLLAARLAGSVRFLLEAVGWGPAERVLLVPVPSASAAVRRRGFDATAALARHAARRLRGDFAVRAGRRLAPRTGVQDQAGLSAGARRTNLTGAYRTSAWPPADHGSAVVVVDDVVTTGASLTEAARALRAAGWPVLGAATVGATVRRRPRGGTVPR